MGISITDRALVKIQATAVRENEKAGPSFLRIGVVPGGCSGLTYDLGWDTIIQPADETLNFGDLKVVMDLKSYLYLEGSTLDFTGGLEGEGFHFNNPQATRTCACGESFSV